MTNKRYFNVLPEAYLKKCRKLGRIYLTYEEAMDVTMITPGDHGLFPRGTTFQGVLDKLEYMNTIKQAEIPGLESKIIIPLKTEKNEMQIRRK